MGVTTNFKFRITPEWRIKWPEEEHRPKAIKFVGLAIARAVADTGQKVKIRLDYKDGKEYVTIHVHGLVGATMEEVNITNATTMEVIAELSTWANKERWLIGILGSAMTVRREEIGN